ncbi:MAG: hypothetical protein ABI361_07075 [Nitrososphaera sp.]|jgi:hypothetical protein
MIILQRFLVIAVLFVAMAMTAPIAFTSTASASGQITGNATKCTAVISCTFALTDGTSSGSASTSGYVGGYVGQNLVFSGGSISFTLPGETIATYASGVYSGTANVTGTGTAGTIYHVIGRFSATDTNTGKVVSGVTNYSVGVKGHSGRGGGNTWTLVGGTIIINQQNLDGTTTSMVCNPSYTLNAGDSAVCTVTIADLNKVSGTVPTGAISFSSSNTAIASLSASSCNLSSAGTCSVSVNSNIDTDGGYVTITAVYPGDKTHLGGTASHLFSVVGCQTC